MSKEAIMKIAGAEEEAEKIIQKANQKAKAIVADAQENAQQSFEKAVGEASANARALCENARNKAAEQSEEFFRGVDKECGQLYTDTRDRIDGAVGAVVERVVKSL